MCNYICHELCLFESISFSSTCSSSTIIIIDCEILHLSIDDEEEDLDEQTS